MPGIDGDTTVRALKELTEVVTKTHLTVKALELLAPCASDIALLPV